MSTALKLPAMSVDEYLAAEEAATFHSEYRNGEVFQMAGASRAHVTITGNVTYVLKTQTRGRCRVYASDLRLWVESANLFTYPDVMLTCGEERLYPAATETLTNPQLIVEVLSKSTRNYDRGDKFMHYRSIPSLMEYLTIEQDRAGVEYWIRTDERWVLREFRDIGASVRLLNDVALRLADIYDSVSFGEPEQDTKA